MESQQQDNVLKWEKISGKGAGLETCVMEEREKEEVSAGCSSPHAPIPEGTAEKESALRKQGKQVVLWRTQTLSAQQQACWAVRVHG